MMHITLQSAGRRSLSLCAACFLLAAVPLQAVDLAASKSPKEQLVEAARQFSVYDFENHADPLLDQDRDGDGYPDYWEPVRGDGRPDYTWERVRIVDDPYRAGPLPDRPGRVFMFPYSGDPVAWQTRVSRVVDAKLAYEISVYIRTDRLETGRAGVSIIWLHADEQGAEEVLGAPEEIIAPPGQVDWSEAPFSRRINDLNPRTNRVRFICWVTHDPAQEAVDRHGTAWFDDLRITSRPKIHFSGNFREDTEPLHLTVTYQGLVENLPENTSGTDRKEYYRRIDIRDIDNTPISGDIDPWKRLTPGLSLSTAEMIEPHIERCGVYYVTVTLYGRNREPQATVQQVIGRMKPPLRVTGIGADRKYLDRFSVDFDPVFWKTIDAQKLYDLFDLAGIRRAGVDLWPASGTPTADDTREMVLTLRRLRARGIRFTAILGYPPTELAPSGETLFDIMSTRLEPMRRHLQTAATEFAPQASGWQWGADGAAGFDTDFDPERLAPARETLRNMANAFQQALPVNLRTARELPDPRAAEAVSLWADARMTEEEICTRTAEVLPYYFARMDNPEPPVYPSRFMLALVAAHAKNVDPHRSETMDIARRQHWLSLELPPVDPHLRDRESERRQMRELVRKAVVGRALGFDRINLGKLADPAQGLAGLTRTGELIPRPSLLATRTVTEYLADAEFIGSFQFDDDISNYVFRRGEHALMALWYTGLAPSKAVEIGQGGAMRLVDIFGNESPVPPSTQVLVTDLPVFVDNITLPWALTNMSIRIESAPTLRSVTRMQPQFLTLRNFFADPLDGKIRILYALALGPNGQQTPERDWGTLPVELPVLLPGAPNPQDRVEYRFPFDVRPPQGAVLGEKLIQLQARLSAGGIYNFNLFRRTTLTSDINLEYRPVVAREPGMRHIRLMATWKPEGVLNTPPLLNMVPYYQMEGEPFTPEGEVTLTAGRQMVRELQIPVPRKRGTRLWIGLFEDGGTRFARLEIDFKDIYSE